MDSKKIAGPLLIAGGLCLSPDSTVINPALMQTAEHVNTLETANPLLADWTGKFGGVPPFDKVKVAHFKPALEKAMEEKWKQIEAIANHDDPATFENTFLALERSGRTLDRVATVYGVWSSNLSTAEFRAVELEIEPVLAAFNDRIVQNERLFKRIESVYKGDQSSLSEEQRRLVWIRYNAFVRAGAKLDQSSKKRLAAINQELATAYAQFSQNVLADETNYFVTIEKEEDLAGLPPSLREAAKAEAIERKMPEKWVISNTRSSVDPFLTYADNRAQREKAWRMFVNRGDNGNENDNNGLITRILQLRRERAALLGYKTHAHWSLENTMAKTPERALALLEEVWTPAIKRVSEEVADMQRLADREKRNITIEPWDYRYYMEKVRKEKYNLDQNEIKPYLQLEKLREGMFYVATNLFDYEFTPVTGLPVFHQDVRVWEVKLKGQHLGLFYFDPFARSGKRSGAWMNAYRPQHRVDKAVTTIVSNNSNFVKGKAGEPVLISWDDATTLFHEFGHALHGLSSNVTYPTLSGTRVFRDYVEFPSQLLEHWLATPEILQKFAVHYRTGKSVPPELIAKIKQASTFNQGFATTEYLASALMDMKLHLSEDPAIDPDRFEKETLSALKMPSQLVMRHRTPQFLHIFSGDGYAAGYYSYLWADVLTADGYHAFTEAGGPFDKEVARRLYQHVLSAGNTVDPSTGYKAFRMREPSIKALMQKRGFGNGGS